jgi:SRSO17 transposase
VTALRRQVARQIGSADGVLAVDDTGFEKAGRRSAGVQRQYTGTAGKITNCQIGVFLSYVDPGRHRVLIDRELYLPRSWFAAPDRLTDAAVPDGVAFATKPEQAWAMIERDADDADFLFGWVTGDEAYGDNGPLRIKLEGRGLAYVMAVSCDHQVTLAGGTKRADHLAAELDPGAWQRYSCGPGSKGERRGVLSGVQERGRAGPLSGPQTRRLVPAHHPRHGRPRPPGPHRGSPNGIPNGQAATRRPHPRTRH